MDTNECDDDLTRCEHFARSWLAYKYNRVVCVAKIRSLGGWFDDVKDVDSSCWNKDEAMPDDVRVEVSPPQGISPHWHVRFRASGRADYQIRTVRAYCDNERAFTELAKRINALGLTQSVLKLSQDML